MFTPDAARAREHGLTLVELVMFIVIVSVAVVGILQVLSLTTRNSADPQLRKQALAIAEGLLEEVERSHFTFCDPSDPKAADASSPSDCTIAEDVGQASPEPANSRPYDNVNDYVNAFGTPLEYKQDAAGNSITFNDTYTARISIVPDPGLGPAGSLIASDSTPANMNALRITVTVSYNNNKDSITLDGYRTRYAPNSLP